MRKRRRKKKIPMERIREKKNWLLEKINKILKPFIKLTKMHKEKNKLIKIVMKGQNSNTEKRPRKFSE